MIPYFADSAVGIVQTAQYFDTCRGKTANWMARYAGAIQDSFFTWMYEVMRTRQRGDLRGVAVIKDIYAHRAAPGQGGDVGYIARTNRGESSSWP